MPLLSTRSYEYMDLARWVAGTRSISYGGNGQQKQRVLDKL